MKIVALIIAVLFALFAIVQFNDPDPALWVSWYGFVALAAALTAFRKLNSWVLIVGLVLGGIALAYYFPGFLQWIQEGMESITGEMKAENPSVENVREFLGILLSEVALVYLFFQVRKG